MRNPLRKTVTALAASLALVAAAPAAASAAADPYADYPQERFRVVVEGVTNSVHQNSNPGDGGCGASNYSSGKERVVYRSVRPEEIVAIKLPGLPRPMLMEKGRNGKLTIVELATRARVTRSFTPRIGPTPPECGGTGGGQTVAPDCGTRTIRPWIWGLYYDYNTRDRIGMNAYRGKDPFRNCPAPGHKAYPFAPDNIDDRRIAAELPMNELFDRSIGKFITIARGTEKHRIDGYWSQTTIRWELTLVRIKGRR